MSKRRSRRSAALASTEPSDLGSFISNLSTPEKVLLGYLAVGAVTAVVHIIDRSLEAKRLNKELLVMTPQLPKDAVFSLVAWPYTAYQWVQAGYFPIVKQLDLTSGAGQQALAPAEQRTFAVDAGQKAGRSTLKVGASRNL